MPYTRVAIWWRSGDRQLSIATRRAIERAEDVFLNPVSPSEIFVQQDAGLLDLPLGFVDALHADFVALPRTFEHALEGRALPLLHPDPSIGSSSPTPWQSV